MESGGEILTLQLGHYSNYVGTHWWNIQETSFDYKTPSKINNDVLYREGVTLKNEVTFTPRLLLVDLKGSLKALRHTLYEDDYEDDEESQVPEVIERDEKIEPIEYQKDLQCGVDVFKKQYNFEKDVRVWSDFLYTKLHPRSVNIVNQYQHGSKENGFDFYPQGLEIWDSSIFIDDYTDKIRQYIEECNYLQGCQVIYDVQNGFSGLCASNLEYLQDEYKKTTIAFPLISDPTDNALSNLNLCFSYDNLMENTALFVPLGTQTQFANINHQPELFYHSSAVLATFLDTFTLNYRLKSRHNCTLHQLCYDFNTNGRKAAAAALNFPLYLDENLYFVDYLDKSENNLLKNLTPDCNLEQDNCVQSLVLRGISDSRLKADKHNQLPAFKCNTAEEMFNYYMECTCFGSKTSVVCLDDKMKTSTPFPTFFKGQNVDGINALAGLINGKFVGNMFDSLGSKLESIDFNKHNQFSGKFHKDDYLECFNHILDLADCYKDNYLI